MLWTGINGHGGISLEDAQRRIREAAERRARHGGGGGSNGLSKSLTHHALPGIGSRGKGGIPNVSRRASERFSEAGGRSGRRGSAPSVAVEVAPDSTPGVLRHKDWCVAVELPHGTASTDVALALSTSRRQRGARSIFGAALSAITTPRYRLGCLEVCVDLPQPPGVPPGCTTIPPVMWRDQSKADAARSDAGVSDMDEFAPTRMDARVSSRPAVMQRG